MAQPSRPRRSPNAERQLAPGTTPGSGGTPPASEAARGSPGDHIARLRPGVLAAGPTLRLLEREALFIPVRWLFVVFGIVAALLDTGQTGILAWGVPAILAAANAVAAPLSRRLERVGHVVGLGVGITALDATAAAGAMFNYAHYPDTATNLLFLLVVLEAAMRWAVAGGLSAAGVSALVNVVWMLYRENEFGIELRASTALARSGAFLISGLLLGVVIRQLDRASREVRRGARRTDAVGRFALDAPRLSVEEAAARIAETLHDDLDYEFAAVVVVDEEDPARFRLVATAGYEDASLVPYDSFPTTEGVVGRSFRTGRAQLLTDVSADSDYLEVDPRTRSEMTVPLVARGQIFGAIDVGSAQLGAFSEEDLRFLEAVAAQLALAFDNARLAEIERRTIGELEELSAMKDDFIAIANHELRTPVTTIAGFAQSLLKQRDVLTAEEVDDAIERLARQSAHLKRLIEDLLTAPGSRGRRGVVAEPVAIRPMIEEVVRELDPDDGIHTFDVDVADSTLLVQADRSALRRVLTNLVGNAVKYSPGGGPVTVRAEGADGTVRVDVVDVGLGVDPTVLPLLFTKFGRATGPDGELRGGMGLGLFIVKELVEEMGGMVGVESEPGRGSCFWFSLPAARGATAGHADRGDAAPWPTEGSP